MKEIAHKVRAATEATSDLVQKPIEQDDPLKRKPDISKAKELLEWEPTVSIEEGLRKTIDYFKSIL
jgi:UDP-glucuronate decarboxylase